MLLRLQRPVTSPTQNRHQASLGASILEVALTIFIFVSFILVLIDLARYFFAYIILSYAVHSAADMGSKAPLEAKTRATDCTNYSGSTCETYQKDLKKILASAQAIADWATVTGSTPGNAIKRAQFHNYDSTLNNKTYPESGLQYPGSGDTKLDYDVGVIRPGERQLAIFADGEQRWYSHPTRAPEEDGTVYWPQPGENWASILDANPVQFVIAAKFTPITPFIPTLTMEAKAFAFRKGAATSQGAPYPTMTPTPDNYVPTATPTPPPATSVATATPDGCDCSLCSGANYDPYKCRAACNCGAGG